MFHVEQGSLVFIRSSVLPGACDKLSVEYNCNVVPMPEFLTERNAQEDMITMPVLCGEGNGKHDVRSVLNEVFEGKKKLMLMKNREAELSKYAHNLLGLSKVTMCNGIYDLCETAKIDYEKVRQGFLMSGHIGSQHTQVPGPDNEKGFGGKCFPNNLEALIGYAKGRAFAQILINILCLNRFYRGLKDDNYSRLSTMSDSQQDVPTGKVPLKEDLNSRGQGVQAGSASVVGNKDAQTGPNIKEAKVRAERSDLLDRGAHAVHAGPEDNIY